MVYFVFLTRLQRCREAELKVIPVFTMLDENLELSMAASYSSRASCMAAVRTYYYFQMMSLLIVYEY